MKTTDIHKTREYGKKITSGTITSDTITSDTITWLTPITTSTVTLEAIAQTYGY